MTTIDPIALHAVCGGTDALPGMNYSKIQTPHLLKESSQTDYAYCVDVVKSACKHPGWKFWESDKSAECVLDRMPKVCGKPQLTVADAPG